MKRIALFLAFLAFASIGGHAAPDRSCNYTNGATTTKGGFENCTEELVEIYTRAKVFPTVTGTNTYVATSSPVVTALTEGLTVSATIPNTNTAASTLKLDGTATTAIALSDGSALAYGELRAGSAYEFRYTSSQWRIVSGRLENMVITAESLGAKADGGDDGARISAGLYARFNGLAISQSAVFRDIQFQTNKTYTLATPITVRQQRLRFYCNGATLNVTGTYGFDITQDTSGNGNESGLIHGCKITNAPTTAIRGRVANFWRFESNEIRGGLNGIDLGSSIAPIVLNNYFRDYTGIAVKIQSAVIFGGGVGESQRAQVIGNKFYGVVAGAPQYGLNLIDGGGHIVMSNDFEQNEDGEIYVQSSFGNQFHANYSEPEASSPFVVRQDNTASIVSGRSSESNVYDNFTLGGGAVYDFDILAGVGAIVQNNRLGTGNINVGAAATNTLLMPNTGQVFGTLTNTGTNTLDMRAFPTTLAGKVDRTGDTMTGKLIAVTPSAATAAIRLPSGAAPTTKSEGDMYAYSNLERVYRGGTEHTFYTYSGSNFLDQQILARNTGNDSQFVFYPITTPSTPQSGAAWNDGTDFSVRIGAATAKMRGLNTGDQTITLSGVVSGTGTGAITTTIGTNVVPNTALAQMPANTIRGNNTGSTANVADLTVAQVNTLLGTVTTTTINNATLPISATTSKATSFALTSTLNSTTAPTVSGFCTSPSVTANNGTAAFAINVGTACAASTGTITLPAAATGWVCDAHNVTTPASNVVEMSSGTTTTVVLTNYARMTGIAANFTSSDSIRVMCAAY